MVLMVLMVLIGVQRYNIFLNYANAIMHKHNYASIITCRYSIFTVITLGLYLEFAEGRAKEKVTYKNTTTALRSGCDVR